MWSYGAVTRAISEGRRHRTGNDSFQRVRTRDAAEIHSLEQIAGSIRERVDVGIVKRVSQPQALERVQRVPHGAGETRAGLIVVQQLIEHRVRQIYVLPQQD